jgi:beta-lactamase superfamily II metal-dependent hydrolase
LQIDIFDVEHGSCALVTTDNGKYILVDCGHNSTTGWRPSTHLWRLGVKHIDQLIITNCDRDHASDLPNILKGFTVGRLTRNPSITGANLRQIKGVNMSPGIDALAGMMDNYTGSPGYDDLGGVNFIHYWNNYPDEFTDENNLSLLTILTYGTFWICFPGDMEEAGWLNIARLGNLLTNISYVDVLVASHHGRDSGRCQLLYESGWKPQITIISDSGIEHATQETVNWYHQRTKGIPWDNGSTRRVLTTRSDGAMRITTTGQGFHVQIGA